MVTFNNIELPPSLRNYHGSLIIYTVTDDFANILKISIKSLNISYKEHPPILVLTSSRNHYNLRELSIKLQFEVLYYDVEDEKSGPVMLHLPSSIDGKIFYTKLLLWSNLFCQFENIFFIDADTIVFNKFDELFKTSCFMVEYDSYISSSDVVNVADTDVVGMLKEDGIRLEKGANAGVFLLPKNCRSAEHEKSIFSLLNRYRKKLLWADQTLINLWMVKNSLSASSSKIYNYQTRTLIHGKVFNTKKIKIFHLNGIWGRHRVYLLFCLYFLMRAKIPIVIIMFLLKNYIKIFRLDPDREN